MNRIAIIVWHLDRLGGMERHIASLATALHNDGRAVAVFVEMPLDADNAYAAELRQAGVEVIEQPVPLFWFHKLSRAQWNLWLTRRLLAWRPDALHIHNCRFGQSWLLTWAERHGIPAVYTEHTAITDYGGPLHPSGPSNAMSARALACVSEQARRDMQSLLPHPRPVAIARHIVETSSLPEAPEPGLLLCTARLEAYKGVDILLEALPADSRLIVAGEGSHRRQLESLAGSNVEFAGAVHPGGMAELYARAEVAVLPSRAEGLPLALLEAMAAGKPIVAAATGGIPDVIRHNENGLLVEPRDPDALRRELSRIAADEVLRRRLGEAARQTFEEARCDAASVVADTLALYRTPAVTRIAPDAPGPSATWRDIWNRRDILTLLVRRDAKLRFGKSSSAVVWAILQPLLLLAVLTAFATIAGLRATDTPYPLFAICGLLPWTYFTQCVSQSTHCLVNYAPLIGKLRFPRLILPLSVVTVGLMDLLAAGCLLPVFFVFYGVTPSLRLLALPLFLALAVAVSLGAGLWLAVGNVRFRRVANLVPLFLQLLFFATPIAYSSRLVPEAWRPWLGLNPMAGVVDGFRWSLLGAGPMPESVPVSGIVALALLLSGVVLFRRQEPALADKL